MDLNGKKILVTGACGFIGANILRRLAAISDAKLFGVDLNPSSAWRLSGLAEGSGSRSKVNLASLDISDPKAVNLYFSQTRPDIVFHCAVYGMYMSRETDKARMIDTNIKGLLYLAGAAKETGALKFINTGTNSEYGPKDRKMTESMVLEPDNTYGLAKAGQTLLASQLADEYGLDLVTLRLFAPYGPFEAATRLVPSIILANLENRAPVLGSPQSVRNFTYVDDIVDAFISAACRDGLKKGVIINVGSGKQYSVADIAGIVKKMTGSINDPQYGQVQAVQTEPRIFVADNTKARKELKWKTVTEIEAGLKKTVDWFKANIGLYRK